MFWLTCLLGLILVCLPAVVVWSHQRLCVPLALKAPRLMLDLFLHPSLINHLFTSHPLGPICSLFYCAPFCCQCLQRCQRLFALSQCHEEIEIVGVVQAENENTHHAAHINRHLSLCVFACGSMYAAAEPFIFPPTPIKPVILAINWASVSHAQSTM